MRKLSLSAVLLFLIPAVAVLSRGYDDYDARLTPVRLARIADAAQRHTLHVAGAAVDIPIVVSGRVDPYYLLIDEASVRGLGLGYRGAYALRTPRSVFSLGASFSVIAAAVDAYFPDFDPGFGGLSIDALYARPIVDAGNSTVVAGVTAELDAGIPINRKSLSQIFDAYIAAAGFPDEGFFQIAPFTARLVVAPEIAWHTRTASAELGVSIRPGVATTEPFFRPELSLFAERTFARDGAFTKALVTTVRYDVPHYLEMGTPLAWPVGLRVGLDIETHSPAGFFLGLSEGYPTAGGSWAFRRTTLAVGFYVRELSPSLWGYSYPVYYLEFLSGPSF